jgi:tripartite-type tricarboxylate transporter receptor subunit TctC
MFILLIVERAGGIPMYKGWFVVRLLTFMLLFVNLVAVAHGQTFYKDKTIRLVVGYAPGGTYDAYARLTARHIGRHVLGTPAVVVDNMPGANSLLAARYVTQRAAPDGLTVGMWNSVLVLREALGDPNVQIGQQNVRWIGALSQGPLACVLAGYTGIRSFRDVLSSNQRIRMGATGVRSYTAVLPTIMNHVLGTNFEVRPGYDNVAAIVAATQSREVDGFCFAWETIRRDASALLQIQGNARLIPVIHGPGNLSNNQSVPTFSQVFRRRSGGDQRAAIIEAYLRPTLFKYPLALPPGTPEQLRNTLRGAFDTMVSDPNFLNVARRSNRRINAVDGQRVRQYVDAIFSMPSAVRNTLAPLVL